MYSNYATDTQKFNIKGSELDAIIKFEIMDDNGPTQSWEAIDEKYGRVRAYQVAANWPLPSDLRRRRQLESIESITDLYLDTSYDITGEEVLDENLLPLEDCIGNDHLKKVDENIKKKMQRDQITKCVDLTKANISGGTENEHTEHVVIMTWQHCERFKPAEQCASKEEKEKFFDDIKVTLEIA